MDETTSLEVFDLANKVPNQIKASEENGKIKIFWNRATNLYFAPVFSTLRREGGQFYSFTLSGNNSLVLGAIPLSHANIDDYFCLLKDATVSMKSSTLYGGRGDILVFKAKNTNEIEIYIDFFKQELQFTVDREFIGAVSYQKLKWEEGFRVGICGHNGARIEMEVGVSNVKPAKRG